jgi:hypothetical protein
MLVWDVVSAFVLVLGLYAAVIGLLHLMQKIGWTVDWQALRNDFVTGQVWNVNSPSFWLVLLALTNIVPTLLHVGWTTQALFIHWLSPQKDQVQAWLDTLAKAQPGAGLNNEDAHLFARYLLLDNWVSMALVASLAMPAAAAFVWGIPHMVGRLL